MQITFRQGIITYPTAGAAGQNFLLRDGLYVHLNTQNGRVDLSFAHRGSDYLFTESSSVQKAWGPIANNVDAWLYWNIDTKTGKRTFGYTTIQPVYGNTAPSVPVEGQHWFDTSAATMKVYTQSTWKETIRVFAGRLNTSTFYPMGDNLAHPYAGSQVGINQTVTSGRIVFDKNGHAIIRSDKTLFTVDDQVFVSGSPVNTVKLEASVLQATALENMAAFSVVRWAEFDKIAYASYTDISNTVIGIITEDVTIGNVSTVVAQGVVTNLRWNWPTVGQSLWIGNTGELITTNPYDTDPTLYSKTKPPVARVLSPTSILFDQGLGGVGEKGDTGSVGAHRHPATQIDVQPHDEWFNSANSSLVNGQQALEELADGKVNRSGDTMTGFLTLNANPTAPLHAATKSYVDGKVNRSGDTMTGLLTLSGAPTAPLHAATKTYVDDRTLNDLADVTVAAPADKNILTYELSSRQWKNKPISAVTSLNTKSGDLTIGAGANVTIDNSNPSEIIISADTPSSLQVSADGAAVTSSTSNINFVGSNWTVTDAGSGRVDVEVATGGGSGGPQQFKTDVYNEPELSLGRRSIPVLTPVDITRGIKTVKGPLVSLYEDPAGSSGASYSVAYGMSDTSTGNSLLVNPGPTILGRYFYSGYTIVDESTTPATIRPALSVLTRDVKDVANSRILASAAIDCGEPAICVGIDIVGTNLADDQLQRVYITAVNVARNKTYIFSLRVDNGGAITIDWSKTLPFVTAGPRSVAFKPQFPESGTNDAPNGQLLVSGYDTTTKTIILASISSTGTLNWCKNVSGLSFTDAAYPVGFTPAVHLQPLQYTTNTFVVSDTVAFIIDDQGVVLSSMKIQIPSADNGTVLIDSVNMSFMSNSSVSLVGRYTDTATASDMAFQTDVQTNPPETLSLSTTSKVCRLKDETAWGALDRPVLNSDGHTMIMDGSDVVSLFWGTYDDNLNQSFLVTAYRPNMSTVTNNDGYSGYGQSVTWSTTGFGYQAATYTVASVMSEYGNDQSLAIVSVTEFLASTGDSNAPATSMGVSQNSSDSRWKLEVKNPSAIASAPATISTAARPGVTITSKTVTQHAETPAVSDDPYLTHRYRELPSSATEKGVVANSLRIQSYYTYPSSQGEVSSEGGAHNFVVSETGVWNLGPYPYNDGSSDYNEGSRAGRPGEVIVSQGSAKPPVWKTVTKNNVEFVWNRLSRSGSDSVVMSSIMSYDADNTSMYVDAYVGSNAYITFVDDFSDLQTSTKKIAFSSKSVSDTNDPGFENGAHIIVSNKTRDVMLFDNSWHNTSQTVNISGPYDSVVVLSPNDTAEFVLHISDDGNTHTWRMISHTKQLVFAANKTVVPNGKYTVNMSNLCPYGFTMFKLNVEGSGSFRTEIEDTTHNAVLYYTNSTSVDANTHVVKDRTASSYDEDAVLTFNIINMSATASLTINSLSLKYEPLPPSLEFKPN